LLFQDLDRHGLEGLMLARNASVSVAGLGDIVTPILATTRSGRQFAIGLHGPLTPDMPPDEELHQLKEFSLSVPVVLIDELVVRRNLPAATSALLDKLG
jgi:hypothetical protein